MVLSALIHADEFIARHIGPSPDEQETMLAVLGLSSLDALVDETIPIELRFKQSLPLPLAVSEADALHRLALIAKKNKLSKSYIGLGYYPTLTPTVILRNVLENPGWYTAYTPYQAEIAQGRLEALLNYQQMIVELTGLEVANASLLDEATAAAEAIAMARRATDVSSCQFFVDERVLPQTLDVLKTRATYFGFELIVAHPDEAPQHQVFGALFQYPGEAGDLYDIEEAITAVKARGATAIVAADCMAMVLLKAPAELGADIAIGSTQRFGVPMGFGGPHAAFFAFRDAMKRFAPGRIIGVSVDARGKPALRMALQTREQHIRREKANSNICTSQVLLANIAGMYAVYHGPEGLTRIATRIHRFALVFAQAVLDYGDKIVFEHFYDTVQVNLGSRARAVYDASREAGYTLRQTTPEVLGVAFHEASTYEDLLALIQLFTGHTADIDALDLRVKERIPTRLRRVTSVLAHPVFHRYHTEHEMLRYLKRLENKDLALNHSMIPLGSCTMKLNAASEMIPISWPQFSQMHPFAPRDETAGYLELMDGLVAQLKAITGFDAVSLQPNSGAQGEYAGLLAIRRYYAARGEGHRNICLIPKSAHGTNPASAQMIGLTVIVVECDPNGNVMVADLEAKAKTHAERLAALMITYPSTHGVFEPDFRYICECIHHYGGQVYMDGANLNAQLGLIRAADIGVDVSHMNLHKTFCIPHGGGGPGVGPIGLKAHLAPFMPNHVMTSVSEARHGHGAVSAAPFGSASILPIAWMYITMMGEQGLTQASKVALLNANYIAAQLADHYPILYRGTQQRVAHECIIDLRPLKALTGVTEVDVAKRLIDYGFHAPTMSFPVPGTLMIEPTESESKAELDRFIEALIAIRAEIEQIALDRWPADNNPLKHAPHTAADLCGLWERPYTREQAVFPLSFVKENKFWPSVNRINDVFGDRNFVCQCPPTSSY